MSSVASKYNLVVVLGPTASGKTALAAGLAHEMGSEIISADSRQIYRGMDIGTGKDLADYIVEGRQVPYHLIDIVDAGYRYNVYEYQRDFFEVFNRLSPGMIPVMCGGTGLYIESVLKGYKLIQVPDNPQLRTELESKGMEELKVMLATYKKLHNTSDTSHRKRLIRAIEIEEYYSSYPESETELPELRPLIIGTEINREKRRDKISSRLRIRLEKEGMVDEVKALMDKGVDAETLEYYGLEYKYLALYLQGKISYEEMFSSLETAIHRFAKRQMTWFRGMEKRGSKINWIDIEKPLTERKGLILDILYS